MGKTMEERLDYFSSYNEDELYDMALRDNWERPEPLFDEADAPPDFPVFALPEDLAEYVTALAKSTQTPEAMAGSLALGVLASVFQGRYVTEITPDWTEPLNLYVAAVAGPGERKSAVMKAMTAPLYNYETRQQLAERVELTMKQSKREVVAKRIERLKLEQVKKSNPERERELLEQIELLESMPEEFPFRLLIDDSTPEKLMDVMDEQGGRITVCSTEGGVFQAMNGRYDGGANFDVYLKGHAGDPITVDRIGRRSNIIINPRLTMLLTVQPEVISGIMRNSQMRGRGLCARFLYSWCDSMLGRREINPPPVDNELREHYISRVEQALSGEQTGVLPGDAGYHELRLNYQELVEHDLVSPELEGLQDWGGKLVGAVCRIAALIHCWYHPLDAADYPIGRESFARAAALGDFFAASARRAYNLLGYNAKYNLAHYVWTKLLESDRLSLTHNELHAICRGKCPVSNILDAPLRLLESAGYIRLDTHRPKRGRPSGVIEVNPLVKIA